jgi:quercetin dioxygenase-like cupin family protein
MTNGRRDFLTATLMGMAASMIAAREAGAEGQRPAAPAPAQPLAQRDMPKVNLDGWQMTASEVSYAPGRMSGRHRHPGFVIGYVLEGEYLFAVNDNKPVTLGVGKMFFESFDQPGEVHAISGNASKTAPCKILAIVFHKKGDPVTIPGA